MRFLKYIRQWGKKVVFLVNKVDILSSSHEVGAAVGLHPCLAVPARPYVCSKPEGR